jgi:glycosyltransferase involved in cell wall biosynthesis
MESCIVANRVAWVSPMHAGSAIGRFSRTVVSAMNGLPGVRADLVAPAEGERLSVVGPRLLDLVPSDWAARSRDYDHIVYNLGNNFGFHEAVFEAYLTAPGVVVLHDRNMLGFFLGWLGLAPQQASPDGVARFLALMARHYGPDGVAAGRRLVLNKDEGFGDVGEARRYTLLEPCFSNACGVVAHSDAALREVNGLKPQFMPSLRLRLPFVDEGHIPSGSSLSRTELGLPEDMWVIVSSGLLHPSKRIELLLLAVASSPLLRDRVIVVAAGDLRVAGDYADRLQCLAHDLGLAGQLFITGVLDERRYYSYLRIADSCAALRSGQHESASATLAEQLHLGKPTLVNRTGVFAEVPDDVVLKLDPDDEIGSARRALEALVQQPGLAEAYGLRAREYARSHFSAGTYAEEMLLFLESLGASARLATAVHAASVDLIENATARSLARLSEAHARLVASDTRSGTV